jgi:lipopolysaccharide/colanic/teichoic acid biosynthesis glycosyltransferase
MKTQTNSRTTSSLGESSHQDSASRAAGRSGVFSVRPSWNPKRLFDVFFSSFLFILLAPVMALIALFVKMDSSGPVLYQQTRVGVNRRRSSRLNGRIFVNGAKLEIDRRRQDVGGQPIRIMKFRSMSANAEADGKAVWSRSGDPRVTRFGNLLRKTHLDELPQLVNVLKGEMSLVGPRPERPEFVAELKATVPGYERRLAGKPGVTGLAQINHRADESIEDVRRKVRYDLLYLRNAGVKMDLKIIMATMPMALGLDAKKRKTIGRGFYSVAPARFVVWVLIMLFSVVKASSDSR